MKTEERKYALAVRMASVTQRRGVLVEKPVLKISRDGLGWGRAGMSDGQTSLVTVFHLEREGRKRSKRRVVLCEWDQWTQ
jgi:hypothetical protein